MASYGLDSLRATKLSLDGGANELFADAKKLDSFLKDAIPAAVAWYEDAAFIAGGGTSGYGYGAGAAQPQGILNAPCAITVTRGLAGPVALADVYIDDHAHAAEIDEQLHLARLPRRRE